MAGDSAGKPMDILKDLGYIIAPIKRNNKNEEKRNDKDQNKICTEPYRKNACG